MSQSKAKPGRTLFGEWRIAIEPWRLPALNAFMLFLQIPPYESPILECTEQMFNVHLWQDLPNDMPFIFLSIMHAFLPGFQLAEGYSAKADFDNLPENAKRFATLFNEKTFERNLDIIIAGLEAKYGLA